MTVILVLVTIILGILTLALLFPKRFQQYRSWLLAGALLMFAISIGVFLAGQPGQPDISSTPEPLAADTPASTPEAEQPPTPRVSSISPVSPVAATESVSIELGSMEAEYEGCLLFVSDRSGESEIYKLRGDDGSLQQLTNSPGLDISPASSPDGKSIAFASNRMEDAGFQIYVMDADGSNQERLGMAQAGDNSHPSWSPDGSQIAFQSKRDINSNSSDDNLDIYVMNSDGDAVTILVDHPADDSEPGWSPDGGQVAFISERNGHDEIYLMNSDGTDQTRLTELAVLKSGLSWSEDGRIILFEGGSDIYLLDVETLESTNLTRTEDVNETTPEWIGEGIIAFSSNRAGNWDLYLADISNPDKIRLVRLTDDPSTDLSPAWFPCMAE